MEIEKKPKFPPIFLFLSPMTILLVLILLPLLSSSVSAAAPAQSFAPQDNYLIDCGAKSAATVPDGRALKTEDQTGQFMKAKDDILVSILSADGVANPVYLSSRIFKEEATYTFDLNLLQAIEAFINAIEVVSVPDSLITYEGAALSPVNRFFGLTNLGYQIVHRLNMDFSISRMRKINRRRKRKREEENGDCPRVVPRQKMWVNMSST